MGSWKYHVSKGIMSVSISDAVVGAGWASNPGIFSPTSVTLHNKPEPTTRPSQGT